MNEVEDRSGASRAATQCGQLIAYLSEVALAYFGAGWVQGGRLDLSLIKPVHAGDSITVRGMVCDFRAVAGGTRIALDVWMESQSGERIAAGWISGMAQPQCQLALNVQIPLPPAAGTRHVESRIQA